MKQSQRITSTKQFDGMIKVTGKWVWIVLTVLILLVVGMVTFGFSSTIERKIDRAGLVMDIPMSELFDISVEEYENVLDANELELYMMLDNLNPFTDPDLIRLYVTEQDLNKNQFNLGTPVHIGSVNGVITYMSTTTPSTYSEIQSSTGLSEEELSKLEVYPGQQYFYVLIGPDDNRSVEAAAETARDAETTETAEAGELSEEELTALLEAMNQKSDSADSWLKDVDGTATAGGQKIVPCEIIVQSVKLSSFILK